MSLRFFMYFCLMDKKRRYIIRPYSADFSQQWDDFVDASRNATFILRRGYMDYHADRFADRSLIISAADRIIALFAACEGDDGEIAAHAGLTYGGLIMPASGIDGADVVDIFNLITDHYRKAGYRRMRYKAIPHIFHRYPAEEDIHALFRSGATLAECNLSSTILLSNPIRFNENSRRNMRRAEAASLSVGLTRDFSPFWHILSDLLATRYDTRPVHSLDEITLLASRFPDNIRLITATNADGATVAGTVLYITPACVHAQYIAASPEGKAIGALPLVFRFAIDNLCSDARYFDFGTSNEHHGLYLNAGLLTQKNGMGGRGITYNIYTLDL